MEMHMMRMASVNLRFGMRQTVKYAMRKFLCLLRHGSAVDDFPDFLKPPLNPGTFRDLHVKFHSVHSVIGKRHGFHHELIFRNGIVQPPFH